MAKGALSLIGEDLPKYCKLLVDIPEFAFWVHETQLAQLLQLPTAPEHGPSEVLTTILASMKKGFEGNKRNGTRVSTEVEIVNVMEDNDFIYCQQWGALESFAGGYLNDSIKMHRPRWFRFGKSCAIDVKEQLAIAKELSGDVSSRDQHEGVLPRYIIERRRESFTKFYQGNKYDSRVYCNWDVPHIAHKHVDLWEGVTLSTVNPGSIRRRAFSPEDLDMIEMDFRLILSCSNIIGKVVIIDNALVASKSTRRVRSRITNRSSPSLTTPSSNNTSSEPPVRQATDINSSSDDGTPPTPSSGVNTPSIVTGTIPDFLRQKSLQCTIDGTILWVSIPELASLELMFVLATKYDVVLDCIEVEMEKRGVALPESVHPLDLYPMSQRDLSNVMKNINSARDDLFEHLGGYFEPTNDELLYEWLRDGSGYTNGRRLQSNIFAMNESSRQKELTYDSSWKLRHIFFSFNLPAHTISSLWACFYAIIMDRPITKEFFACTSTIWNHVHRLHYIDKANHATTFNNAIKRPSKYGFQRHFHISSDDSKHFKKNRHILIMTTFAGCDMDEWTTANFVNPTCRLVTSAVNMVKSSNAKMNADELITLIGLESAAYIGGCTTDNAGDALNEGKNTFKYIMSECANSGDDNLIALCKINGVERRPITFGDPYHWANLAVMHASKGMSGDTENGEHEQIHHRQLLMSMHSLHSDDAGYSQTVMDRVMHGRPRVQVRTWRERQQRWLVNQRFAGKALAMLLCSTGVGVVCLVAWGLYFSNFSRSSWK